MKIRIGITDWYPIFYITDGTYWPESQLTKRQYEFICKAQKAYEKAQAILRKANDY